MSKGEITTMRQLTAARELFEKKLQDGRISEEEYKKKSSAFDRVESRILNNS